MAHIADVRNEVTKALRLAPEPLYAVAGAGELAVEKLRDAQDRLRRVQLDRLLADLPAEARHLPERLQAARVDVSQRWRDLPSGVVEAAADASVRVTSVYDDLTARGRRLVDRFAGQQDGPNIWPTAQPPEPTTAEPRTAADAEPTAAPPDSAAQPEAPVSEPAKRGAGKRATTRGSGTTTRNGSPRKRTS